MGKKFEELKKDLEKAKANAKEVTEKKVKEKFKENAKEVTEKKLAKEGNKKLDKPKSELKPKMP